MLSHYRLALHLGLIFLTICSSLFSAEKLDLDRLEPVPADQPIPIMDFFRSPYLASPQVNPSGTYVAARVTPGTDNYSLLVMNLETQEIKTTGGSGNKDVYQLSWLNDERIIFGLSQEKRFGMGLMAVNIDDLDDAYPIYQYGGARIVGIPLKDRTRPYVFVRVRGNNGGLVVLNTNVDSGGLVNVLTANLNSAMVGEIRDSNERHTIKTFPRPKGSIEVGYSCDKNGEVAFAYTMDDGVWGLHYWTGDHWGKSPLDLEEHEMYDTGERAREIVARVDKHDGEPGKVRFVDAATGELGEVLLRDEEYDFDGWFYRDPASRVIVGAMYDRAGPATVWFDESYRSLQKILDGYFPKKVVRIVSGSETGGLLVVSVRSDREPVAYYAINLEKRTFSLIKSTAPWIDPERMRPMSIVKFKTRDGHKLDAYLTMPATGSKENPVPLIVLPHGGPAVRDTWGFDRQAQFFASRGYAVLQPNYRGSPGYDWHFPEEDQWDFIKMHNDVTDAAKAIIKSGYVDPDRVAIMGGSFGAYLALSGAVHEPDMYRCIVAIAGVFDWGYVVRDAKYDQFDDPEYGWLLRKLGNPKDDPELFERISPARFVENMKAPIFVAHGTRDPVASVGESKRLVSELRKHDIEYEVYFAAGEGHGMAKLKNEVELYSRIEKFLKEHL